ncbi:MAG: hypothetical protein COB66_06020 [Coxiella sp. (in: Bacteria)]|nr:MAG: hypothetical protein COB66_06020 [Coxiella sp. (in: g-proteobacteria)]
MSTNKQSNKWPVLGVISLLTVVLNIDATAVHLAIPVMSRELHAQLSTIVTLATRRSMPTT